MIWHFVHQKVDVFGSEWKASTYFRWISISQYGRKDDAHIVGVVGGTKWEYLVFVRMWWEQNCVYFVSCVSLCSGAHTVQAYLPAFSFLSLSHSLSFFSILFILLYSYIHILSDWANCSCSCILRRFNYTPLWATWKKNEGGKRGMWAEKCGRVKDKKVKSEKGTSEGCR